MGFSPVNHPFWVPPFVETLTSLPRHCSRGPGCMLDTWCDKLLPALAATEKAHPSWARIAQPSSVPKSQHVLPGVTVCPRESTYGIHQWWVCWRSDFVWDVRSCKKCRECLEGISLKPPFSVIAFQAEFLAICCCSKVFISRRSRCKKNLQSEKLVTTKIQWFTLIYHNSIIAVPIKLYIEYVEIDTPILRTLLDQLLPACSR